MKNNATQFGLCPIERYIVLSRGSQDKSVFYQDLRKILGYYPIFIDGSARNSFTLINSRSLCFVDLAMFDMEWLSEQLKVIELSKEQFRVVFYNSPDPDNLQFPLTWPGCVGCLSADLSFETLEHVMEALSRGEHWFSRNLSSRLLQRLLEQEPQRQPTIKTNLTKQELKVLSQLSTGASNAKMAEAMFLSEHTVKSHLYRIYRKINVSSRSEALAWCHNNLPRY